MVWTGGPSFQAQGGVGAGLSGMRLVGALGRDQTYVPTGNHTHRKGNGGRGGVRTQRDMFLEAVRLSRLSWVKV